MLFIIRLLCFSASRVALLKIFPRVLWKEMLDPVSPRLTGTCCTAWGWSRRRVRRVSYLSPRAEIVVVFLAEGVQDIKVAGKKTFFSCEISFVGVIFFINSQSCFYPLPLSLHFYICLCSHGWGAVWTGANYISQWSICMRLCVLFFSYCFASATSGRAGEATEANTVWHRVGRWCPGRCVCCHSSAGEAFWISLLHFVTFVPDALLLFMFCFFFGFFCTAGPELDYIWIIL